MHESAGITLPKHLWKHNIPGRGRFGRGIGHRMAAEAYVPLKILSIQEVVGKVGGIASVADAGRNQAQASATGF